MPCEAFPDEAEAAAAEEDAVTLRDYVESLEAQEEEADAVLGGGDCERCTYEQGYVARQAVFACLTCTPPGAAARPAGFCTACSLACHDQHEVVELWTRRRFRCDCGNAKFGAGAPCTLQPAKEPLNGANSYNQNYAAVYCTCSRPYPDPARPAGSPPEHMIQCCCCEDWFHEEHLGLASDEELPTDEDGNERFSELVCQACAAGRCSFLASYAAVVVDPARGGSNLGGADTVLPSKGELVEDPGLQPSCPHRPAAGDIGATAALPGEASLQDAAPPSGPVSACAELWQKRPSASPAPSRALFLAAGWRSRLCKCEACSRMYEDRGVTFLLDDTDTLQHYEEASTDTAETRRRRLATAQDAFIKKLPHVQQIELARGMQDMAANLKSFLAPFCEDGRVVQGSDIHNFFSELTKKRRRLQ
eukprot:SM000031S11569  [mRNA]  locus=s31:459594:461674:+ [translate_table: standard]